MQGQAIPLDIRYEDDDMLVISKQAGLVCHPSIDHSDGTLVNALIYHCGAENLCNVQGESDPGPASCIASTATQRALCWPLKTMPPALALMADIRDRAVDRRYLALVHGVIPHDTGMIDAPIARVRSTSARAWRFAIALGARCAHHLPGARALRARGARRRLHAHRLQAVHGQNPSDPCSYAVREASVGGRSGVQLGAPKDADANFGLDRQFLHSFQVGFTQPMTGEGPLLCR